MKPLLFTMSAQASSNDSSLFYGYCLRGKTRAVGEPASVTDEKPALTSAGRSDLAG